jgi:hypothetical protein
LATVATTRTHDAARVVNQFVALTDGYTLAFRISSVIALCTVAAAVLVPAKPAKAPVAGPGAPAPATAVAVAGDAERGRTPGAQPAVAPGTE